LMAVCGAALLNYWWAAWPGGIAEELGRLGGGILLVSCVASLIPMLLRLQSAEARERQQLKWFAYGAGVFLGAFFLMGTAYEIWGAWAGFVVIVTGLSAFPVAVGIAILRYRLYDIDILINRTLVYGALTALLAAGYFATIMALEGISRLVVQAPFRAAFGQESALATVAATLAMAALFNPLRHRIQSFIDRRFYRSKYDARKTLEAFSAKLRDETDLQALSDDLVRVVSETMQPAHVSLWLHSDPALKHKKTRAAIRESGRDEE
jgi:hypothetical protein